jgi:hypothetical protein
LLPCFSTRGSQGEENVEVSLRVRFAPADRADDRTTRGKREPPSDADIERGLRERAVSDPRAAEILLRWQHRPRQVSDGDELEQGLTEEQLEGLYAALLRFSALTPEEQSTLVQGLLDGRA